jgi:hypothetical protein
LLYKVHKFADRLSDMLLDLYLMFKLGDFFSSIRGPEIWILPVAIFEY